MRGQLLKMTIDGSWPNGREIAVELKISPRNEHKKSQTRSIRREGDIPAVIYSSHNEVKSVCVDGAQFLAALREIKKGHLPNTTFKLKDESGKAVSAIVKDIQYHKVNYNILHLDFLELSESSAVTLNVPVEMIGQADCVGVKAGGALRLVKRHVSVKCLPKHIPQNLEVNVIDLQIKGSKRIRDVQLPANVEVLAGGQEVVAVVGKR
jgi:large subunit ribosomal protein L25